MKLDILVIAAHPDDAEMSAGGTIALEIAKGKKVGVVDLTEGELGTRGNIHTRRQEAQEASKILGLSLRENLGMPDGFFVNDQANKMLIIEKIRQYRPQIVLTNAIKDRHPDHARAALMVFEACFLAGLPKIITQYEAWRPENLYHFIQSDYIKPDFVVDISDFWHIKLQATLAYRTQFHHAQKNTDEPETFISSENFIKFWEGRAREFGQSIRVKYGEGFTSHKAIGVHTLSTLI